MVFIKNNKSNSTEKKIVFYDFKYEIRSTDHQTLGLHAPFSGLYIWVPFIMVVWAGTLTPHARVTVAKLGYVHQQKALLQEYHPPWPLLHDELQIHTTKRLLDHYFPLIQVVIEESVCKHWLHLQEVFVNQFACPLHLHFASIVIQWTMSTSASCLNNSHAFSHPLHDPKQRKHLYQCIQSHNVWSKTNFNYYNGHL